MLRATQFNDLTVSLFPWSYPFWFSSTFCFLALDWKRDVSNPPPAAPPKPLMAVVSKFPWEAAYPIPPAAAAPAPAPTALSVASVNDEQPLKQTITLITTP